MITVGVDLPRGAVAVPVDLDVPPRPRAAVALAHGAGSGREHPFLVGFARALRDARIAVLRFDFPYRAAGRRMPGPAAHAVATWSAVLPALVAHVPGVPLVAAGKSYGGRMASVATAERAIAPDALVYLGYPFHPPGKPDAPRAAHLPSIAAPQLFVAGEKDPFLQPLAQFTDAVATCQDAEIHWVAGGGHSFEVAGRTRPAEDVAAELAASVLDWLSVRLRF